MPCNPTHEFVQARGAVTAFNKDAAALTQTTFTQTYSTATATVPAAFTDSTTGAVGTTLAAGTGCYTLSFPHTFIGGTSAVEPVTNLVLGHKFKILSWQAVSSVLLVG